MGVLVAVEFSNLKKVKERQKSLKFVIKMVAELYSQLKELCHVDIDKYLTWFPENVTNVDMLKNIPDFPLVENLVDGLLFGLMLCLARFILDKLVFQPVGKWCMKLSGNEKFEHFSIGKE